MKEMSLVLPNQFYIKLLQNTKTQEIFMLKLLAEGVIDANFVKGLEKNTSLIWRKLKLVKKI
jgi:hypothetical protein